MKPPKEGTYLITNFIKNGNVTSSSGYTQTSTTYTVPNPEGGYVKFPVNYGTIHNPPSLRNNKMISKHLIYGRCEQKVPSNAGSSDSRFEWWPNDTYTIQFATIGSVPKDNEWHLSSNLAAAKTNANCSLRNFSVRTTGAEWYRKNFLMFDVTAIFGEGNEPDKEWLNTYLPFFENTYELKVKEPVKGYAYKDNQWNKIQKFFVKDKGIWREADIDIKINNKWLNKEE